MENPNLSILTIENLLTKIAAINKKYESIAEITGENFNIFRILKRETREVETHSAFIAELLNPKGSHGMKEKLLELFITQFNVDSAPNESKELQKTQVNVEEVTNNGRIDIVIKFSNGRVVVIENKIYANDQGQQLVRYKEVYKNCHLLYLTLNGNEPSDISITKDDKSKLAIGKDFLIASYKEDIIKWLVLCQKESASKPLLRETILQYIYLIKHLAHQTMNEDQKHEIVEAIVNNPNYIESAESVYDNWDIIRFRIIEKVTSEISKLEVCEINNLKFETDPDYEGKIGEKGSSFYFFKENWKYCICFYFGKDFDDLCYGISNLNTLYVPNLNLTKILSEKLRQTEDYPDWYWVNYFNDWSNTDWRDINKEIPGKINEKIKEIITVIDSNNIDLSM